MYSKEESVFETDNLDLGAYLMLEGIKYLGARITVDSAKAEPKAILKFDDRHQNCLDLERVFLTSREKNYRELNKYLLKEIHSEIRKFNAKLKAQMES